jgi:hypothetical protein
MPRCSSPPRSGTCLEVGLSLDLGLIVAGELRPGFAVASALRNAAAILSIWKVIETMFWFSRELMLPDPVFDWTPGPIEAGLRCAHVAQFSDLHAWRTECWAYKVTSMCKPLDGERTIARHEAREFTGEMCCYSP